MSVIWDSLDDLVRNSCLPCIAYFQCRDIDPEQESIRKNKGAGESQETIRAGETVWEGNVIGRTKEGRLIRVM